MKVITEEILADPKVNPPDDGLNHKGHIQQLFHAARILKPGSVIAIQGAWGRGKSDLLWRIAKRTYGEHAVKDMARNAVWLNPWRHGNPDLLTPLVRSLAKRLKKSPDGALERAEDWQALSSLLAAGVAFGMKGLSLVADSASGGMMTTIAKMVEGIGNAKGAEQERLLQMEDPVERMGIRFKDLVTQIVQENERLLICVDDLDRCLPERQVALLEAIHFLTATDAPVIFMVAIDPLLAEKSLQVHFKGSDAFDPKTYLSKIFNYRFNLPAVGGSELGALVKSLLAAPQLADRLKAGLNLSPETLIKAANQALPVQEVRNPRTVERILERLAILAQPQPAQPEPPAISQTDTENLIRWLALAERWPEIRFAMQDVGEADKFSERLNLIRRHHIGNLEPKEQKSFLDTLPKREDNPALAGFLNRFGANMGVYLACEQRLRASGM